MQAVKEIFEPQSVAVIGASVNKGTVGHSLFSNLIRSGFQGTVYPVNPKYSNIMSVRSYPDINSIPDPVDLAVICVPGRVVPQVMHQCGQKKVKGLVIISAGFKEVGEAGAAMEKEIVSIAKEYGIPFIGPNCLGIINTDGQSRLNANFAARMPEAGNVALVSQSGAIGVAALEHTARHELGLSKFISIGNKAVLDESDVLGYLIGDDQTRVITMYIEDISRPSVFFTMARKAAEKNKPIIAIKTGRSLRGAMATKSHTGALSGSDTAYDSLFAQCGVIRVEMLEDLFIYAKGFSYCPGFHKGKRVAILTNAGGMGVLATDAVERNKLEMASFEEITLSELKKVLPPAASLNNPVDMTGDADAARFSAALEIVARDKNTDAVLISVAQTFLTDLNEIALSAGECAKRNPDTTFLANMMALEQDAGFSDILKRYNIPNFDFPEVDIRVLAAMTRYVEWAKEPVSGLKKYDVNDRVVAERLRSAQKEKRAHLTEAEAYPILQAYGMNVLDYCLANDLEAALESAAQLGYPVVLKAMSPDILHKFDFGAVQVNLKNEEELIRAYQSIGIAIRNKRPDARIDGFLLQKYFTGTGLEMIAGANRVTGFGSLLMFGLGGIFVELFKDVAFRLAPLTEQDAKNMIGETKGYQILKGFRGQAPYDLPATEEYLLRLSQLVSDFPQIKEVDINPLMVLGDSKGIVAMDAKMIIETDGA